MSSEGTALFRQKAAERRVSTHQGKIQLATPVALQIWACVALESISYNFENGYMATVSYNNQSNSWSTAFSHDGSFLDCSFSGSLSSSGALGFGVNCAVDNSYLGF